MKRGKLKQNNKTDGTPFAEFRRSYFKNGSYAGAFSAECQQSERQLISQQSGVIHGE